MERASFDRIARTTRRIVEMLVAEDYSGLEQLCGGVRLSSREMEAAIRGYDRTLCPFPEDVWDRLDIVEITDTAPPRFSVRVDLWSVEEGRSDLSLELTLVDGDHAVGVEIDDLHVL